VQPAAGAGRNHLSLGGERHSTADVPAAPPIGRAALGGRAGALQAGLDRACSCLHPGIMPDRPSPMQLALAEAEAAAARGEVPVGAVVIGPDGSVLAAAGNRVEELHDPTAHAELLAIRSAAQALGVPRLVGCDLWVTLEPCPMCAQAISFARIRRLYFGAADPKGGGVEHGPRIFAQPTCHHAPEVYSGIGERRAAELLRTFFRARRAPPP
jgi:tRNA(adenine34) deaminase